MVKLTGGGIQSRVVKQSTNWKREPVSKAMSPEAVAQQGAALAFKRPDLVQGPGYQTGPQQSTGIASAYKGPAGAGPGGMGRTIYPSGSQTKTPVANPPAKGRDILSEYGPERSNK